MPESLIYGDNHRSDLITDNIILGRQVKLYLNKRKCKGMFVFGQIINTGKFDLLSGAAFIGKNLSIANAIELEDLLIS